MTLMQFLSPAPVIYRRRNCEKRRLNLTSQESSSCPWFLSFFVCLHTHCCPLVMLARATLRTVYVNKSTFRMLEDFKAKSSPSLLTVLKLRLPSPGRSGNGENNTCSSDHAGSYLYYDSSSPLSLHFVIFLQQFCITGSLDSLLNESSDYHTSAISKSENEI